MLSNQKGKGHHLFGSVVNSTGTWSYTTLTATSWRTNGNRYFHPLVNKKQSSLQQVGFSQRSDQVYWAFAKGGSDSPKTLINSSKFFMLLVTLWLLFFSSKSHFSQMPSTIHKPRKPPSTMSIPYFDWHRKLPLHIFLNNNSSNVSNN